MDHIELKIKYNYGIGEHKNYIKKYIGLDNKMIKIDVFIYMQHNLSI
jgi:hypothetical protein